MANKKCKHDLICICDGLVSSNIICFPLFKCKKCLKLFSSVKIGDIDLTEIKTIEIR